ncbi:MAG: leucine-rich repeat domain-containing protein [Candidatus Latescibacterota bacterium]
MTHLVARERGIASLAGIDSLTNLTVLDLADNQIRDISPLAGLIHLTYLDLENNRIQNIAPLAGLTQLEALFLGFNAIADISALTGLTQLRSVGLEGIPLGDASSITQLAVLRTRGVQVNLAIYTSSTPSGCIAFSSDREGTFDIYLVDVDGTHLVNLTRGGGTSNREPAWSPDFARLAFISDQKGSPQVFVMELDAAHPVPVSVPLTDDPASASQPQWSPQGDRIVYVDQSDIMVLSLGGGSATNLTHSSAADILPCWSPDGARIAFSSDRARSMDVYVMNADGSQARRLTQGADHELAAAWTADGMAVIYAQGSLGRSEIPIDLMRVELRLNQPELWAVDVVTGHTRRFLAAGADAREMVWSPDRQFIAFTSRQTWNLDIWVSTPDGDNSFNVTTNASSDITPSWSPRPVSEYVANAPAGPGPAPAAEDPAVFHDPDLEMAVRLQAGKTGGVLRRSDVQTLKDLDIRDKGIADLSGMEALTGIETLVAKNNRISDLKPLAGLRGLWNLSLNNNRIRDVSPLSGLKALAVLSLNENQIEDVTPLTALHSVMILGLTRNQIRDISPLASLTPTWNLDLALSWNPINDLRPLLGIPHLTTVKVRSCPLDDYSRSTVIPALRKQGVDIVE